MDVANRRREGVCCIGRYFFANPEQRSYHELDLCFTRVAVADDGELYLRCRILVNREAAVGCREQCDAARLPELQRALSVARKKDALEAQAFGLKRTDRFVETAIDQAQPVSLAACARGGDGSVAQM